jgi:hypothetical protein
MPGLATAANGEGAARRPVTARAVLLGFAAGVLSVLVVFQGAVWLLNVAGVIPLRPFSVQPIPPLGVPQFVNQAFWGGLWGMALAALLRRARVPDLLFGFAFGAVALDIVVWFALPAIKGTPYLGGGDPKRLAVAVFLNGSFGWGAALALRWLRDRA